MQFGFVGYRYEDVFHLLSQVCKKRGFKVQSADASSGIIHAVKLSGILLKKSNMTMKVVPLNESSTRIEVSINRKNKEDQVMEAHVVETIYHFF
ncbi:MAG: hypothetical protein ABI763_14280 [Bacteroidota bacterium]